MIEERSNYELMLAGEPYISDDPQIVEAQRRAVALAARFAQEFSRDPESAQALVAELLGAVGDDVTIRAPIYVDYGSNIRVGDRTFINYNLTALDVALITIGSDCQIATGVQLLTPTHPLDSQQRQDKAESAEPITIGDNVWLGGGVIVCPGVTIGDNSVIGAGSVVTRDIPANSLAVGNPARVIRELT